ncbi:hypothetical protein QRD89_04870 [Halobacillus sp. ACCC02827]|uniref:hypothetical protein n=1 Tax=Bacillaceae TaxID=186817 RepID=UPI0002A4FC74|nr:MULTISPECIES: hypothetical protein [Bacillaceae]ELK47560.1 hypothetical protein D479_05655 [Halobacillus sp. BAB-2008]QHT45875.1 hypothetical protein M662_05000 [Bacillus sp. SB49]WJE16680.1 hypothetical protein QRD89_04870 [Halobacillus sp. ACCC02827]
MSQTLKERLSTEELGHLQRAAVLEFTEDLFESDNYCSLEAADSDLDQLFIVNRNDRTLTVLSMSKDMSLKKETLFTDRIISMKEYFEDYSMNENTAPRKIEVVFDGGRTLLIEPDLSGEKAEMYKKPEIARQVQEEFENLIAALKNTVIL